MTSLERLSWGPDQFIGTQRWVHPTVRVQQLCPTDALPQASASCNARTLQDSPCTSEAHPSFGPNCISCVEQTFTDYKHHPQTWNEWSSIKQLHVGINANHPLKRWQTIISHHYITSISHWPRPLSFIMIYHGSLSRLWRQWTAIPYCCHMLHGAR